MKSFWPVRIGSIVLAVLACLGLNIVAGQCNSYIQTLLLISGIYVTLAVSLNLINGITGQFSIGHFAFLQIGAYTAAALSKAFYSSLPFGPQIWIVVTMLAGAAVASLAGFIVGLPSLRLKGDYLAIVTLGFGEIIRISTNNIPYVGLASGMTVTPKPHPDEMMWLVWLLAILTIAVSRNLLKTAQGLRFLAVREDEVASAAMGVNVTGTKVTAFVLGSAFAGAAGALFAHQSGFILPSMFKMENSFIVLTMVVLGGTGSITGSALAAVVLYLIPEYLRDLKAVPITLIAATVVALIVVVGLIRQPFHGDGKARAIRVAAIVGGGLVGTLVLQALLGFLPFFSHGSVDGLQLRIPIFAVTLIVLMLLRPQGIFAHHEFSWDWVRSVVSRKKAVAA